MLKLLSSISIRNKIIAGFSIVVLILLAVGGMALHSFNQTRGNVDAVVSLNQPVILAAERLDSELKGTVASMGFYMLSRDEASRLDYEKGLQELKKVYVALKQLPLVKSDSEIGDLVRKTSSLIAIFETFHDRAVELAENDPKRISAVEISSQRVNPQIQSIRQILAQMIDSELQEDADEERREILNNIHELRFAIANLQIALRGVVAFNDQGNYENATNFGERTKVYIDRIRNAYDDLSFEGQEGIDQIEELHGQATEGLEELFAVQKSEKAYMDVYFQRTEISPVVNQVSEVLAELVGTARSRIEVASDDLSSQVENAQRVVLILVAVGVIVGVLIAVSVTWSILTPLHNVIDALRDIAQGEGDLTRRLDERGRDELASMAHYFNLFVEKIRDTVVQTADSVERLVEVSSSMSRITEETAMGVDQQNAETERAATAMNEMASSSSEVADNARFAAQAATDADGTAQQGQTVVSQTMNSITALAREVEKASDVIGSLQEDSLQIGTILDVIRSIAEQTNLLALNAAIEAARAGEQGRGFAVVADEVRTLASRTQDSTEEIQAMIERLQRSSEEAVSVMREGSDLTAKTVDQAEQTSQSLQSITQAINSINEMNHSISVAAEEQSQVAEEINQNIVTISDISQQTAQGAGEVARASEELRSLAETLKNLVGAFRI
jgi:methyl-accepting chemotaxis protein